jgi:hypothetical protein
MSIHILVVEISIEIWVDLDGIFVFGGEDDAKRYLFVLLFCALLW